MKKVGTRLMGLVASSLCTIHCMATPFLISTVPSFVHIGHNHWLIAAVVIVPTFLIWYFTFFKNQRLHSSWLPSFLFLGSIIGQSIANAAFHFHGTTEIVASVITAIIVFIAFTTDSKLLHKGAACDVNHKH